jgi:hypothetical protein
MPVIQINFKLNVSSAEYGKICDSVIQSVSDVPGLVWKIWMLNEQQGEAGGIYLFQDEQSLAAYLAGPIVAQVKTMPQLREISVKQFDVMPKETAVTKGPIPTLAAA